MSPAEIPPQLLDIYEQVEAHAALLEKSLRQLQELSWGPSDDGSTAQPLPDGTASTLHKWLDEIANSALGICEYRKNLWDPYKDNPTGALYK